MNICTYASGLFPLCLSANSILYIENTFLNFDEDLKYNALELIGQFSQQTNNPALGSVRLLCAELHGHMNALTSKDVLIRRINT